MKATNQVQQAMNGTTVINGIEIDTLKATIGAIRNEPDLGACHFRATNKWLSGNHNRSRVTGFYGAQQEIAHKQTFRMDADEPAILAGNDKKKARTPTSLGRYFLVGSVFLHDLPKSIFRQFRKPESVRTRHGLCRYQGVDDSFFSGLDGAQE